MNTRLISILKGKGLLTKVEEKAKKLKNRKNLTLLSDFKRKEEKNDIISDNKMLVEKIQKVRPYIGNKKEWKIHEEQFKTMERRLCNKTI